MLRPARINLKRDEIVGESRAIRDCLDQVAQCAGTDTGVLITGETGTGKELFARAIHVNSPRAQGPLIVVDCASLPDQLVESILFGHARGAFTGADCECKGLIEQADGGTLFLDEIGELPLETQKSFLRVLQDHVFRPVGKNRELKSNFRLVAATNRDLAAMVQQGLFRSDLYFRLNTFSIHLPPLRDREGDIEKLVMSFVFTICRRNRSPIKGVVPETLASLSAYHWPGNVRELLNVLEKAILPLPEALPPFKDYRRQCTADLEVQYLRRLLREAAGDIVRACAVSGLSRSRLYDLLKVHGLGCAAESRPE